MATPTRPETACGPHRAPEPDALAALPDDDPVTYCIDAEDIIVDVNERWRRFALENEGGPKVVEPLGRRLWDYIADQSTRKIMGLVVDSVREADEPLTFPYRCDSPTVKRSMSMTVSPLENRSVGFRSEIVAVENNPMAFHFTGAYPYQIRNVNICGHCRLVRVGDQWMEAVKALESGRLTSRHNFFLAIYRTCPTCKESLHRQSVMLMRSAMVSTARIDRVMLNYREAYG